MSFNTFGRVFRVTTWGESHGPSIGCVIDGCPPGLPFDLGVIQAALDRRRPGASKFVTQRREPDAVQVLSGVFADEAEGRPLTTGAPISLLIENIDARSKDYDDLQTAYRPGHADFTYDAKYGARDWRGGGRSSARETACRVAAGAVAMLVLKSFYGAAPMIRACLVQIGPHAINRDRFDWAQTEQNPLWCPDAETVPVWEAALETARKAGSSLGAVIEIAASGFPAGLGAPVYGKLDADLAAALMSINAAKGVEIGAGMKAAELTGEVNADEIRMKDGAPHFLSNHAGGVLGGVSTGQDIVARFAVKPTSSILTPRRTITRDGKETEIVTKGRHDPCVGIRAVPVGAAMAACVLADHALLDRAQCGAVKSPWR